MTREDKVKTLKLHLAGLYQKEAEVEDFQASRPGLSFNCLKLYWLKNFYYQQGKHKNKQAGLVLKKVREIQADFQKCRGSIHVSAIALAKEDQARENVKYLLRIDDFPHWSVGLDVFRKFLEILQKDGVPCLLGVTPCLSSNRHNPENQNFRGLTAEEISTLSNPLIEIALHGFTHQTRQRKFHSEFIGLSVNETEDCFGKALEKFDLYNLKADAFIPPFNTIDLKNYEALKKRFRIICGGPETIRYFGFKITPVYLSGALYVPSYRPLCGGAEMAANFLETFNPTGILPITLHWAGETDNDFAGVKRLVSLIKGKTIKWENLL
jgi:peptidoglycan/xylan/chitin deacetylase (PgdA/CDA1 family)